MNIEMFERLPQEKQEKILQACLDEFAAYGFDAASTNRIVKQAGIPKGSLFQYFGGKESLFLYMIERIESENERISRDQIEAIPSDFFEAIIHLFVKDLEYLKSSPKVVQLMRIIISQPLHPVYQKAQALGGQENSGQFREIISAIPRDQIRDDIDFEDVIKIISVITEAMEHRMNKLVIASEGSLEQMRRELEVIIQDFREFFAMLRFGVYKR
ncbi:TetR family transcriptional regulator [Paenibacillus lautus]|uniref:TetR/AcrR family transcriptional regulator n=1 Tax=Paenibacillus lautus TaxID=1401 RepID=UPI001B1D2F7D|nr:TetR/AcrR family transcriptional regulator [Paenibacillus lautus]GIO99586.1 TetR family transcriptional regulator [Paenibacillus lautus]